GTGFHFLGAQLDNRGLVTVDKGLAIDKTGAAHVNKTTIDVAANRQLTVSQSPGGSFQHLGVIHLPAGATCLFDGGEMSHDPGTTTGPGRLEFRNCSVLNLTLTPTSAVGVFLGHGVDANAVANSGTLLVQDQSNAIGTLAMNPGALLRIDP